MWIGEALWSAGGIPTPPPPMNQPFRKSGPRVRVRVKDSVRLSVLSGPIGASGSVVVGVSVSVRVNCKVSVRVRVRLRRSNNWTGPRVRVTITGP